MVLYDGLPFRADAVQLGHAFHGGSISRLLWRITIVHPVIVLHLMDVHHHLFLGYDLAKVRMLQEIEELERMRIADKEMKEKNLEQESTEEKRDSQDEVETRNIFFFGDAHIMNFAYSGFFQ